MAKPWLLDIGSFTGVGMFFDNVIENLEKPSRWTKGAIARDKKGNSVHPSSPQAVSWCVTGSIMLIRYSIQPTHRDTSFIELAAILRRGLKLRTTLNDWNDQSHLCHDVMLGKLTEANRLIRKGDIPFFL